MFFNGGKFIYHHLGLGDHIICNGLVREIINNNDTYFMFVKEHNLHTVSFMYRDVVNLKFIVGNDSAVIYFINENLIPEENIIKIGFSPHDGFSWDEFFYVQHKIPFNFRWDKFKVIRDISSEISLYDKLNPYNEEYVLIHSKGSDNVDRINYSLIDENVKKIYVDKVTDNLFDYLLLIEKAKEVHCVESSFNVLVDSLYIGNNLFFHTINNGRGFQHKLKRKWNIV